MQEGAEKPLLEEFLVTPCRHPCESSETVADSQICETEIQEPNISSVTTTGAQLTQPDSLDLPDDSKVVTCSPLRFIDDRTQSSQLSEPDQSAISQGSVLCTTNDGTSTITSDMSQNLASIAITPSCQDDDDDDDDGLATCVDSNRCVNTMPEIGHPPPTKIEVTTPHSPSGMPASTSGSFTNRRRSLVKQGSAELDKSTPERCGSPIANAQNQLEEKRRRREDKAMESVLKTLSELKTPEEKLAVLCTKYAELEEEKRLMQRTLKQTQKTFTAVTKDKELLEAECNKQTIARNKLETLCRELQKCNRAIKSESLQQVKDQEEKRKEVSSKFQHALNDLHDAMHAGKERSTKLHEENTNLSRKLQSLIEQYEAKEEHTQKILTTRALEVQLLEAKLAQANLQLEQADNTQLQEKEQLIRLLKEKEEQILILLETEKHLKEQVAVYADKYEDFQSSLKESNNVFQSFKSEMDKMTKRLAHMDKETKEWKLKWKTSNDSLIKMAQEKAQAEKELAGAKKKTVTLEELCRGLQEDRRKILGQKNGVALNSSESRSLQDENSNVIYSTLHTPPSSSASGEVVPQDPPKHEKDEAESHSDAVPDAEPQTECSSSEAGTAENHDATPDPPAQCEGAATEAL